jgi:hypothetical protein
MFRFLLLYVISEEVRRANQEATPATLLLEQPADLAHMPEVTILAPKPSISQSLLPSPQNRPLLAATSSWRFLCLENVEFHVKLMERPRVKSVKSQKLCQGGHHS